MKKEFKKTYDPKEVEERWYKIWMEKGFFYADANSPKKPYCIVIPPPNITGSLHMGHALNNTLQDILIRWKRMDGYNTLWLPGTDHAGIATQNVIERQLSSEGRNREQLGREEFIRRVWRWREESGRTIINQLKKLGASCDWSRERFTLDDGLSVAVREVFVRLYEEGLIYRGIRLINWCPRCRTALSDLEVEYEEVKGNLYYIKYPLVEGKGHLTIATTRPETMLGDTAVAVYPTDKRYQRYIGKKVLLPIVNRELPIIADDYVDPKFGTGALKITPAHDPYDFEIGQRHNLPQVKVIDEKGVMSPEAGVYAGRDRFQCRKDLLEDLKNGKFLVKVEEHSHSVGHCYRCKTMIEPCLSEQWFIKMKPIAEPAIKVVKEGKIRFIPQTWEGTYFDWMYNIKDWCISRQIWWGHQIPAWYCKDCGGITVERIDPTQCRHCKGGSIYQDSDVLDTWFSSALWPFSALGWPQETLDLKVFYPTSTLVTAFDILFFWVARMIMMGLKFTGEVPFRDVYIHALVRDPEGKKMSKSRGNVIDPLVIMDKYGTDALRFTLSAMASPGRDIKLSEERIEGYRHFANKIWNAARFIMMILKDLPEPPSSYPSHGHPSLADRWILSRYNRTISKVREALEGYRFDEAANTVYQFLWHGYCDWYLEMVKPLIYQGKKGPEAEETISTLLNIFEGTLRLLHPFMPFITEEIWQQLPKDRVQGLEFRGMGMEESIMISPYPITREELIDIEAEKRMGLVIDVINEIRSIRGELNLSPSLEIKVLLRSEEEDTITLLKECKGRINKLTKSSEVVIGRDVVRPKVAAVSVAGTVDIYIPLEGLIDLETEREKLKNDLDKLKKELFLLSKKLGSKEFRTKAPADVVAKDEAKMEDMVKRKEKIEKLLKGIGKK